jgi:hypothetical protein
MVGLEYGNILDIQQRRTATVCNNSFTRFLKDEIDCPMHKALT